MHTTTIRSFDARDHGAVLTLYAAARPLGMQAPAPDNNDACRYVAEGAESGQVIGYGAVNRDKTSDLKLVIHPEWQRRGIGSRLWERLRADQTARGAAAIRPWVRQENAAGIAWLEKHGFVQIDKDGPVNVVPETADLSQFAAIDAEVAAQGITVTTLAAEMARDPECMRNVHALYTTVEADVPRDGGDYVPESLESFTREWNQPGQFQDGFFIAVDAGHYVGLSMVGPRGADPYFEERNDLAQQALTGVLPEYRRRGIAIALKMRTIAYAGKHGFRQVWTNSSNPAMRALNWKMGFRTGPWLVYYQGL